MAYQKLYWLFKSEHVFQTINHQTINQEVYYPPDDYYPPYNYYPPDNYYPPR